MATKEPTINANIDESTELSKKRTREAADRTLMAWIRRASLLLPLVSELLRWLQF